ncbi:PaaI family thioesterase [soil metagenome]
MSEQNFEERKLRAMKMVNELPFSKLIGMQMVEMSHGEAVIEIDMRDDLRHPGGILHGGVTATLIDTAMAFAIRSHLDDDVMTATIDLTVHYLRPHIAGKITCTSRVVKAGKRIFTVAADVVNAEGKLVATGISSYTTV